MFVLNNLILVVTHECNLRCRYCFIVRNKSFMDLDIALKAISIFFSKNSKNNNLSIKFFGGEPLLRFGLIKDVVEFIKLKFERKNVKYTLTTNGTLMNKDMAVLFKDMSRLELFVSVGDDKYTRLRVVSVNSKISSYLIKNRLTRFLDVGINITITPYNVEYLYFIFIDLLKKGFKKFNFLPAYFIKWNRKSKTILKHEFNIIKTLIKNLWKSNHYIYVKNLSTYSSTPLFNNGLVVDCNGDIFLNNLILSRHFAYLRDGLCIGNVNEPLNIKWKKRYDYNNLIKDSLDSKLYNSTLEVDNILTEFCTSLKKQR